MLRYYWKQQTPNFNIFCNITVTISFRLIYKQKNINNYYCVASGAKKIKLIERFHFPWSSIIRK